MDELADSSSLASDPVALRARLAADGYVFLRGLLPAEPVRAAGERVAATLRAGGWTAAGSPLLGQAAGPREALADPAYRAAVTGLAFNALPYLAPLRETVRRILGPQAFSYPVKVLRAVAPEIPAQRPRGRYVHCDYMASGVQDMLTTWIPLAEVPVTLGGLAVCPGGHQDRPRRPRPLAGTEPGWATTCYRPGDVIIFHCLTPHAALPNTSRQLRLSADFRWQQPSHPAPAEMITGPAGRSPELFGQLLSREPWGEPVPAGLALRPQAELAAQPPGPSQLFAAHRAWQRWRSRPGPVH
ncbi:MAG: phytanoyl-CoA dioxygenase family protein [Streptosporangiaceae bacterium]